MTVAIPEDVAERLREHGDVAAQVRQAATVWSHLTPEERRTLGLVAMQMVTGTVRT